MPANDNDAVTSSCGCVFCDLELEPETINGVRIHVVGDCTQYGTVQAMPCTRPVTSAVPFRK